MLCLKNRKKQDTILIKAKGNGLNNDMAFCIVYCSTTQAKTTLMDVRFGLYVYE